ncbi:type II toxin-antitoxin system HipA family toxinoxin YjjJ [Corallococcus sp. H22C18031201]|uniref:type II toxin-antitoxin system HipA family toxin YjjJ n=1 Tax=Citreicoccus inhibens TaxID=2849499 RepID=UPI000E76E160|nr:type II toxin-antitoxin system HipA family toxin YjjJ [Citreicoccus inhibens]MBU8898447.1 type II toxin-antitoxin system HipA family toxin YjjJ [Citreicoccus inhibens]RJS21294.1 type II toxin-antitoxin system HipA family toxinoxin YjjJ [Corallococcus sp. H22C18031201]
MSELLSLLVQQPRIQAGELARRLAVSQPTLSRLIAKAGAHVCRMGKGRATRYAHTRSVAGLGTRVPVHGVDEAGHIHRHGELHLLANGQHWFEHADGTGEFFAGLPPFVAEMGPQGYLGQDFSRRHPDLELPSRPLDWSADQLLLALARRGEDCTGQLILGGESLSRWLASAPLPVDPERYSELARSSLGVSTGAAVGGTQPKFTAFVDGRHVLVKFADTDRGGAASRWRDLLICEHLALETLRASGHLASRSRWMDIGGRRFLEVERCDRVGDRGRRPLLSLRALTHAYVGPGRDWTEASRQLVAAQRLSDADARAVRWLDTFGQLIGNTDRHPGNLSFHVESPGRFRLAPVYDMLPMVFAPVGASLVKRDFEPLPPSAATLDVWAEAGRQALAYWTRLTRTPELSAGFKERCARSRDAVEFLLARVPVR